MRKYCNCSDCDGKRVKGPCTHQIIKNEKINCNCTDCGGKRMRGPCYYDTNVVILAKVTYL
jgi:hypothetical protein